MGPSQNSDFLEYQNKQIYTNIYNMEEEDFINGIKIPSQQPEQVEPASKIVLNKLLKHIKKYRVAYIICVIIAVVCTVALVYLIINREYYISAYERHYSTPKNILNIPIAYLWVGSEPPLKYKNMMEWITYPHILLNQSTWDLYKESYSQYNLTPIVKSDILRLQYIYHHGGIYADFDTLIDYPCLMSILPVSGTYFGRQAYEEAYDLLSNNFIYASEPFSPLIQLFLKRAKLALERKQPNVFKIAGPITLREEIPNAEALPHFSRCCKHLYHGGENWKGLVDRLKDQHNHNSN